MEYIIAIIVVVIILLLLGGIMYYRQYKQDTKYDINFLRRAAAPPSSFRTNNITHNGPKFRWKAILGMSAQDGKHGNEMVRIDKNIKLNSIADARRMCESLGKNKCQAIIQDGNGITLWKTLKSGTKNNRINTYIANHHPKYNDIYSFNYV